MSGRAFPARRPNRLGSRVVRQTLWLFTLFILGIAAGYYLIYRDLSAGNRVISVLNRSVQNVQLLEDGLINQETGQRGFALTHMRAFLDPYNLGIQQFHEAAKSLQTETYAISPTEQSMVTELIQLGTKWHQGYGYQLVEQSARGKRVTPQELLAGKQELDVFRTKASVLAATFSQDDFRIRTSVWSHIKLILFILGIYALGIGGLLVASLSIRIRKFVRPVLDIQKSVHHYAHRQFDAPLPPVILEEGENTELDDLIQDIDEMRSELQKKFQLDQAIVNLIPMYLSANGIADVYERTLVAFAEYFGGHTGSVISVLHNELRLVVHCSNGRTERIQWALSNSDLADSSELRTGRPVIYSDWEEARPTGDRENQVYEEGIRSSLHIPVLAEDKLIAIVSLGALESHFYTEKHLQHALQMMPLVSLAIALTDSEERSRTILQLSPEMIAIYSHTFLYINPAGAELLGATDIAQVLGNHIKQFAKFRIRREIRRQNDMNSGDGLVHRFEAIVERHDGVRFHVEVKLTPVTYLGRPASLFIARDVTAERAAEERLRQANEQLRLLSNLDGLTGITNRRGFDDALTAAWSEAIADKGSVSLILIDIDDFKAYNDSFGHLRGDDCLKSVAAAIHQSVRRTADVAARYGGEEFAVVLPDSATDAAFEVANRIHQTLQEMAIPNHPTGRSMYVTVSIGLASARPTAGQPAYELIEQADKALYEAKRLGKNRTHSAKVVAGQE